MKEFWDLWRTTPRMIGGAIWEFKDQGLLKKDSAGVSTMHMEEILEKNILTILLLKELWLQTGDRKQPCMNAKEFFNRYK